MKQLFANLTRSSKRWFKKMYGEMSVVEKATIAWLVLLLVVSGTLSITGYINRNTELIPQTGGEYREAVVGQPRHLNPIIAGANEIDVGISRLVYSSLFRLNNNLELVNDLAQGYEVSEDQTEYTISLRDDVTWHDDEPFNADDVIFTIRSIQTPDYSSPHANIFAGVEIEKIDDFTILFKLKNPYAPFLSSLTVGITPEHVWESIEPRNASLAEQQLKPVGSGPFKFAEISTRRKTGEITSLRLIRNENYHKKSPYLNEVTFVFFNTQEEVLAALLANQVEGIDVLPLQMKEEVDRRGSLSIRQLILPQYFALFFNQSRNEFLADAGIRNALDLATDREEIVQKALQGQGTPLHLPIPRGLLVFDEELPDPRYDPEAAKQNLDEAGWKDENGDGIREKDGKNLSLKITTTDWPEYIETANVIKEQWAKIGVNVEVEHFGAGSIQQTILRPRDYEVLLYGEIFNSEPPDPYPFWHSDQAVSPGLNFSLFKNDEVDKLLNDAPRTIDEAQRNEKYQQFQGKILELKPALILYQPFYLFAQKDKVRGVNANQAASPSDRFNNIEEWHVNVKRIWR